MKKLLTATACTLICCIGNVAPAQAQVLNTQCEIWELGQKTSQGGCTIELADDGSIYAIQQHGFDRLVRGHGFELTDGPKDCLITTDIGYRFSVCPVSK